MYFKGNHWARNTAMGFVEQIKMYDKMVPNIKILTRRDTMTTPIRIMCVGGVYWGHSIKMIQ